MKKIICIIMFMFVAGFCHVPTDEPTDYIDGKWFRCPEVVTHNENGDTVQIRSPENTVDYHYDDNGREQYREYYSKHGSHVVVRYLYDTHGRLVEVKSKLFRRKIKRDTAGNVIEEALFIHGRLDGKVMYTYDIDGNKIYSKSTDAKGVVLSETWYNYSDNVMVSSLLLSKDKSYSQINEYYPNGTARYRKLKYTGKHLKDFEENCGAECRFEQEEWYTPHGHTEKSTSVTYDESGEVVESREYTFEHEYDSLGRLIRDDYRRFVYFEKGNMVYRCYDK